MIEAERFKLVEEVFLRSGKEAPATLDSDAIARRIDANLAGEIEAFLTGRRWRFLADHSPLILSPEAVLFGPDWQAWKINRRALDWIAVIDKRCERELPATRYQVEAGRILTRFGRGHNYETGDLLAKAFFMPETIAEWPASARSALIWHLAIAFRQTITGKAADERMRVERDMQIAATDESQKSLRAAVIINDAPILNVRTGGGGGFGTDEHKINGGRYGL